MRKKYTFGLPLEYKNFLLGYTRDRGYYVYLPMPFFSGAKITLTNETGQEIDGINYEIEYDTKNKPNSDLGRSHAFYHRENPTIGIEDPEALKVDFTGKDNCVILKTSGWGHFVGVSFFMVQKRRLPQNVESNSVGAICEGNEMIFIDNNPEQTQIGTGTEDYLNQNFWVHDHIYPFDGNRQGYRSCYRIAYPFQKKLQGLLNTVLVMLISLIIPVLRIGIKRQSHG